MSIDVAYETILKKENLDRRIIRINEEIEPCTTERVLSELSYLEARSDTEDEIFLHICSNGGAAYDSLAIYDELRRLDSKGIKSIGICEGYAASAASMLVLQGCSERVSRPSCRFLLHEIRIWAFGEDTSSQLQDKAKEIEVLSNVITQILVDRTGRTVEEVKEKIERRETWLSADEALAWKLIDKIA